MKKGFTTFLSALKANIPPCKKGHPSLRFLSLFLILFLAVGNVWAAYYTPTADEVVIIKEKMSDATNGYGTSTHGAFSFAAEITSSNKQMGSASLPIPDGSGNKTYSTYKLKGNGGVKNMTLTIAGCSKLIIYNKSHSSRYIMAEITPEGESMSTQNGSKSTTSTEITLDGSKSYSIWVYGYDGSNHQDIEVYAFKLIKDNSGADPVAVTGISISPSPASVKVGKTITLTPTITPSNATDKDVIWAVTSGETYASVTDAGVVSGLAVGTAVITATAHDGSGVTQTVTVNVEECPTSGTIYKFQLKTGLTNGNLATSVPTDIEMTTENYLSNLTGGTLTVAARNNVNRVNISNGNAIGFANGDNAYLIMNLDCEIQAGDILKYDITSNDMILMAGSETESTNRMTLSRNVTQVEVDSKLVGADALYMKRSSSSPKISYFEVFRPVYRTITLEYADGVTLDGSLEVVDGEAATKPADPTWEHHRFDGWYNGENPYDWTANVEGDLTLTAHWTQLYTISFAAGEGGSGDAPAAIADKAEGETFTVPANTFTAPAGNVFDNWSDGVNTYDPEDTYTVGTANVVLTANWRVLSTLYAITEGTHTNGSITISPTSQEAGETVTLTATPDADYLFSAWEVVKTEDDTDAGVTVTNGEFIMPAFAVTVNATFVADTRKKVLYVTNNNETATKENDKLYDALKDIYNVSIVGQASEADQTNYDLVVLHESVGGGSFNAAAVAAAKTGSTPVLNTKSYFYNNDRFGWGTPNAGKNIKGATLNSAYCNIASHPLFDGLTITDGFFEITDEAAAKCMQPVGSFVAGKEGYTLATTPNNDSGEGCAIHELTPAQRGASAGKYLMISVSNDKLNALNANGQKLFQNAAAYLIGSTSWTPVAVPTTPEIAGTTAYSAGETIELTASATGESATTVYTWYKGATLEAAKETGAIQTAKTIAENGNVYSKAECVVGDAGTYWCVISNGTDCEANVSVEITVSDASYNVSFVSAHGTAPSDETGISYALPELTESGWVHQGWTANIDVTVDENPVTAGELIANGKTAIFGADVTFTAVWKQIFAVTFNLNGQSGSIASQDIISGEKATEPTAPSAVGYDFGGWFTDAACTEGNEFDFDTPITAATPLYAKWTEFEGCALLVPATSGDALHVGDNVSVQSGSKGATIAIVGMKTAGSSIAYSTNGLSLNGGGADVISVTLNNDMAVGTKISVTLIAANTGSRGVNLLNSTGGSVAGGTKLGWDDATTGAEATFSYTVTASDGLDGTNIFRLQRNNSVYLKCLKVESCGADITFYNLTSAVVPAADKGTVTLGATSVREGYTTTAEYSDIDPLYEFVNWTVSGEGASVENATANPATITVGTEDAVVTLNLRLIPIKFTVEYYDGATPMGSEQVAVNENPTASDIETAKRHYTFLGWSLIDGGDVVALDTITRTEATTVTLYAKYEEVVCPTSGTIFSMAAKENNLTSNLQPNGKTVISLEPYVTVSGGEAKAGNFGSSKHVTIVKTTSEIQLTGSNAYMYMLLDCQLQKGDSIKFDNSEKFTLSVDSLKTKKADIAKNTNYYIVPEEWVGADTILIWRNGNNVKFNKINVIRPAKYIVSFDMMGHGSAIADITNVIEGSKISAPTAPTDADYSFAGWYKENTLENEWDFDNDVVTAATTLYAKWLDKSDATLKSLKYGSTEIELQAGVYEYNIDLAAATVDVPDLTAVPSNPNAMASVTDDDAFDGDGKATSTVVVTPEKDGATTQTYTVYFSKLAALPQVNVTESTTWNFSVGGSTTLTNQSDIVLANLPGINNDANFNSQALIGSFNKMEGTYFQGSKLSFTTEVAGKLTITFRGTNDKERHLQVCVGDGETVVADWNYNNSSTSQTKTVFVPVGKVTLKAFEGEVAQNARIYNMIFNATPDYTREVRQGYYGTICLPNGGVMVGASIFEIAYKDASKIYFDEILNGKMVAGIPYIFLPNEGADKLAVFYTDEANESAGSKNGLVGSYTQELLAVDGNNYILLNNQYCKVVGEAYVGANRAYFQLSGIPTSAPAPAPGVHRVSMGMAGQNTATGVDQVQGDEVPTKMIINGQLFILRGEKMYDAQGKLVK